MRKITILIISTIILVYFCSYKTVLIETKARNLDSTKTDSIVTRKIEKLLFEAGGIRNIYCESTGEKSSIFVEIKRPYFLNLQKIKLKLENMKENFAPVIIEDYADRYDFLIGINTDMGYDVVYEINSLLSLNGRKTKIIGDENEVLYLYFSNSYLSNLKLSAKDAEDIIKDANEKLHGKTDFGTEFNNDTYFKEDEKDIKIKVSGHYFFINDIFEIKKETDKINDKTIRINNKKGAIICIKGGLLRTFFDIKRIKKEFIGVKIDVLKAPFFKKPKIYILRFGENLGYDETEKETRIIENFLNKKKIKYVLFKGFFSPETKVKESSLNTAEFFIYNSHKKFEDYIKNKSSIFVETKHDKRIKIFGTSIEDIYNKKIPEKIKGIYFEIGKFTPYLDITVRKGGNFKTDFLQKEILDSIKLNFEGKKVTEYYEGCRRIPIILKSKGGNIKNFSMYSTKKGALIPITELAVFETKSAPKKILRENGKYKKEFIIKTKKFSEKALQK